MFLHAMHASGGRSPRILRFVLGLALVGAALAGFGPLSIAAPSDGVVPSPERVTFQQLQRGRKVDFVVENGLVADITVQFDVKMENLEVAGGDDSLTFVVPGGATKTVLELVQRNRSLAWRYHDLHWHWRYGDFRAPHDDSHIYRLPYEPGRQCRVLQGYGGSFSHSGMIRNSLDFQMVEGTRVTAARDGLVVATRSCYSGGGVGEEFRDKENLVIIQHSDKTMGEYGHLQYNGVVVQPGQRVTAGQVLGLSGSTGYSSTPHLHFMVHRPVNGTQFETIPTRFKTLEEAAPVLLEQGKSYTAQ